MIDRAYAAFATNSGGLTVAIFHLFPRSHSQSSAFPFPRANHVARVASGAKRFIARRKRYYIHLQLPLHFPLPLHLH